MSQIAPIEVTLTPLQMRAIAALLEGNSIEQSATLAGCHSVSIDRWNKLSHFQEALNQGKKSAFNVACLKLGNAFSLSVDTLVSLMQDEDTATSHRIKCADLILQNALRVAEINEMDNRISNLEINLFSDK